MGKNPGKPRFPGLLGCVEQIGQLSYRHKLQPKEQCPQFPFQQRCIALGPLQEGDDFLLCKGFRLLHQTAGQYHQPDIRPTAPQYGQFSHAPQSLHGALGRQLNQIQVVQQPTVRIVSSRCRPILLQDPALEPFQVGLQFPQQRRRADQRALSPLLRRRLSGLIASRYVHNPPPYKEVPYVFLFFCEIYKGKHLTAHQKYSKIHSVVKRSCFTAVFCWRDHHEG